MKNKKGQALIEFILILPVLLLILFMIIDFGKIILCKNHLENTLSNVVTLKENNGDINAYLSQDEYKITYKIEDNKIILETKLDLITPGLKNILKNPYKVTVERRIIDE